MPINRLSTERAANLRPAAWAFTQIALGKALQALGEKESGSGRLHEAVFAYQAAMQDRVLGPLSFAAANNDLGDALVMIAEGENSAASLKEAASAYRVALDAQPADAAALDRARTQIHLTYALGALWNRTREPKLLEETLQAADAALRLIEKAEAREQLPDAELARDTILAAMGKGKAGLAAAWALRALMSGNFLPGENSAATLRSVADMQGKFRSHSPIHAGHHARRDNSCAFLQG
jgi:tetratricopeptide (TPR) repeat protein